MGSVTDALHNPPQFTKNETISEIVSSFKIIWVLSTVKLAEVSFTFPSVLLLCVFVASGSHTVEHITVWKPLPSVTN